uniref:Rx_N domain-containing protein n=1 Tax=Rhabditophanes sp. KR3021 TaxID=114890 RepID=A0AC35UH96_9BILA
MGQSVMDSEDQGILDLYHEVDHKSLDLNKVFVKVKDSVSKWVNGALEEYTKSYEDKLKDVIKRIEMEQFNDRYYER